MQEYAVQGLVHTVPVESDFPADAKLVYEPSSWHLRSSVFNYRVWFNLTTSYFLDQYRVMWSAIDRLPGCLLEGLWCIVAGYVNGLEGRMED